MADAVTHIETSTTGQPLQSGVLLQKDLPPVGDAPGCVAYVHFNGPTEQLATLCTGMAVVEPGASPHPPHSHPEEETMIIATGTGEITVNGQVTAVGPGAVMYCAADVLHGIVNTGIEPMTFYFSKWLGKTTAP
ncbi:MAG: cupin domain-containing protein [Janthinobacterium lividum]